MSYNFYSAHINSVLSDPTTVLFFEGKNEESIALWEEAVKLKPILYKLAPVKTETILCTAINNFPKIFKSLKEEDKTESVCIVAVTKDIRNLKFIRNQTEKIQLAAINKNVNAIKYCKRPTERVVTSVLRKDPRVIKYAKRFSVKYFLMALEYAAAKSLKRFEEVQKFVVNKLNDNQLCQLINSTNSIEFNEDLLKSKPNALQIQKLKKRVESEVVNIFKGETQMEDIINRLSQLEKEIHSLRAENVELKKTIINLQNTVISIISTVNDIVESVDKNNQQIYDTLLREAEKNTPISQKHLFKM